MIARYREDIMDVMRVHVHQLLQRDLTRIADAREMDVRREALTLDDFRDGHGIMARTATREARDATRDDPGTFAKPAPISASFSSVVLALATISTM